MKFLPLSSGSATQFWLCLKIDGWLPYPEWGQSNPGLAKEEYYAGTENKIIAVLFFVIPCAVF